MRETITLQCRFHPKRRHNGTIVSAEPLGDTNFAVQWPIMLNIPVSHSTRSRDLAIHGHDWIAKQVGPGTVEILDDMAIVTVTIVSVTNITNDPGILGIPYHPPRTDAP